LTTPSAVDVLSKRWSVAARDFGVAGFKDRDAVARQWVSVPWPIAAPLPAVDAVPDELLQGFEDPGRARDLRPGVFVQEVRRHRHKLKRGHVRANRFFVRLVDVPAGGLERTLRARAELEACGVPNPFGAQRFGRDGTNVDRGLAVLRGATAPPKSRRIKTLLQSAVQSELFNRVLYARWDRGLWRVALAGDVMVRHEPPAMFDVLEPDREQPRMDRLEISPTGPLFGRSTRPAGGDAAALERDVLDASGLDAASTGRLGPGTRRPLRLPVPPDLEIAAPAPDVLELSFSRRAGAYATTLLDELCGPTSVREAPRSAGEPQNESGSGPTRS